MIEQILTWLGTGYNWLYAWACALVTILVFWKIGALPWIGAQFERFTGGKS